MKKRDSYEKQKAQLEWFKTEIGYLTLAEVTPPRIIECKEKLLETRRGSTCNRYLAALSCVFRMASSAWMGCEDNPVRRVPREREPPGIIRFLSDVERKELPKACKASDNSNLYPLVVLALSTGMRRGEVLNLRWPQVDLESGVILLEHTKNRERRRVAIRGHALDVMKEHSKVRRIDSDFVFCSSHSGRTGSPFDMERHWRDALAAAEIKNFRFHDLRHSCASYLAMNGASLLEIAEILGHKTLAMVKRYSHLAESHTDSVVESMNKKIFGA